jgi:hypothetical protein
MIIKSSLRSWKVCVRVCKGHDSLGVILEDAFIE